MLLDAFVKFQKVTIGFVMPSCLSVCLSASMEKLGYHWTNYNGILYLWIFENLSRKFTLV